MNFRLILSVIGIFVGGFLILASFKTDIIKSDIPSLAKHDLKNNDARDNVLNNASSESINSEGISFNIYKDRYLISGNFSKEELEKITKNIEAGKNPGTQYSAIAVTPARGVDIKAQKIGGGQSNILDNNFPKLLDYKVPGQLEGQSCYNIGKIDKCIGYKEANGDCIVCVLSTLSRSSPSSILENDVKVLAGENVKLTEPISRRWTQGGAQSPGSKERPNVPYPYPSQGEPAAGLTEPNFLGERCYKTRDGKIWCARSPAFSLSPYRGPTISGGPIGACGYNKQRNAEQCGTDQWPDNLEIGLCRDITHSAWTPCGPGKPPLQAEETARGLPLTTPPCITWGGCSDPCFCMSLPSGNCKGNLWCVGPPGCTCCPGLACNVCCQSDNYLWDSVTGWCACASQ